MSSKKSGEVDGEMELSLALLMTVVAFSVYIILRVSLVMTRVRLPSVFLLVSVAVSSVLVGFAVRDL